MGENRGVSPHPLFHHAPIIVPKGGRKGRGQVVLYQHFTSFALPPLIIKMKIKDKINKLKGIGCFICGRNIALPSNRSGLCSGCSNDCRNGSYGNLRKHLHNRINTIFEEELK